MVFQTARLLEVLSLGVTIAAAIDLPEKSIPAPGQYLPTQSIEGEENMLTHPLFKIIHSSSHNYLGPIPSRWQPGDQIAFSSPRGKGFQLPGSARRVGLLALDGAPMRMLPLIERALDQNAGVALFYQKILHPNILNWIPSSVEIAPLSDFKENLAWPDFLAVEIARENLDGLSALFGEEAASFHGQVLVNTTMPCRGIGACGVCTVKTRHGWRQACIDGPVFPLKELLHVAR
jgi:hypothetical protein